MYRCDFSESQLKRQAKWLSQQLKMEMTKNAFECAEEVQVQFNLLPHFFNPEAGNQLQVIQKKIIYNPQLVISDRKRSKLTGLHLLKSNLRLYT